MNTPKTTSMPIQPPEASDRTIHNAWATIAQFPAIVAGDKLGLFLTLSCEPMSIEQLSTQLQISLRGANALCSVAAAMDFLSFDNGRYLLTPAGRTYLLPDSPYYWGGMFHFQATNPILLEILEAVTLEYQKSKRAKELLIEGWKTGKPDPEQVRVFTRAMQSQSFAPSVFSAASYDFSKTHRLLDVGGGSGGFAIALTNKHPHLSATVLDLPEVCLVTHEYIQKYNLADRIFTHSSNMFTDPFPSGFDAIFFSNIFHDWDYDVCLELSKKAFASLPVGGRIFLQEILMPDLQHGPTTLAAASFNIIMLIRTEGRQFTESEILALLTVAGFSEPEIIRTPSHFSLVTALKKS